MTKQAKRKRAIDSAKRAGTMLNVELFETARSWASTVISMEAEISELRVKLEAAERDTKRLGWLEQRRVNLNSHYGTSYGWKFIGNHNVNRLFVRDVNTLDLNDADARGGDIRSAIDAAMQPATTSMQPENEEKHGA